jgi:hypothetical protein
MVSEMIERAAKAMRTPTNDIIDDAPSLKAIEEGARAVFMALESDYDIPTDDLQREWEAMDEHDRLPWRSIALAAWNAIKGHHELD